ncbi:MAG: helix-turn-helix domain-containing protein [Balneolaceae bacterium]|nr:helix-turn-helix domain-containing protein [Balneolaceae bacterium]
MAKPKKEPPRGILNHQKGDLFGLSRYHPNDQLAYFIEHYWIVRWDLRGKEPYEQDVLSHPSVHLVFEKGNTRIWGIVTGKFARKLEEKGKVLGVKFRPGGFYPFYKKPVVEIMDTQLSCSHLLEENSESLESQILDHEEDETMVEQAELYLMRHLPPKDSNVEDVCSIVKTIEHDNSIRKVEDIADQFDISKRTIQRLFRRYVGAGPKWVIKRYRLHEAAEQLSAGKSHNWTQLALELGYYDQAHFIRDFKAIVGQTPVNFVESLHRE